MAPWARTTGGCVVAQVPQHSIQRGWNPDPFAEANELRFTPNDVRLAEVGWNRRDLTRVIMQLGQGVWLGEYFTGRERVDIYLKSTRFETPEEMASLQVEG